MHAHHFELSSGVAPQAQLDASTRSKRQKLSSKGNPSRDVIPSTSNLSREQSLPTPPSPADSAICTTANSPSMQIWQPPEPPDHQARMKKFNSLLRTHPYNLHGDLYTSTTTSYLLLLTAALMESQSASDPGAVSVVQHHASPNLEMVAESVHECLFVQTRTLEEHLQSLRMLKKVNPAWRVDPFNFCVDLKEGGREAVVWLTSRGTSSVGGEMDDDEGISKGRWGSGRESVSIVFWRKEAKNEGEKAVCTSVSAFEDLAEACSPGVEVRNSKARRSSSIQSDCRAVSLCEGGQGQVFQRDQKGKRWPILYWCPSSLAPEWEKSEPTIN